MPGKEPGTAGKGRKVLAVILGLLFVCSLAANIILIQKYRILAADPQRQARQEVLDTVSKVSQLMVLPEGEDPTIATVADTEKLKDQAFFVNAEVGDKVLLYTTAKKAILYRPASNKIIEVAPINLGNAAVATPDVEPVTPPETTTP